MLPGDVAAALDREILALARIDGAEGVAPDYVRFRRAVARSQADARAALRAKAAASSTPAIPATPPARRLQPSNVTFDAPLLLDLFHNLLRSGGTRTAEKAQLQLVAAAADAEPALLHRLAQAAAFDQDPAGLSTLASRLGIPAPALRYLGRLLAAPFVAGARALGGALPERDARHLEPDEAGRCPACGSMPALAVLCRDDGRRRLLCGLCGDTWLAPRLMCVACGSRDPSRLATIAADQRDARWVEACDACRRYLKTVDERRLPEDHVLVLGAEEAVSLYLDLLAEGAGYVRPDVHPLLHPEMNT